MLTTLGEMTYELDKKQSDVSWRDNFISVALQVRTPWGEAPFAYATFRGIGAPHAWREEYDIPVV